VTSIKIDKHNWLGEAEKVKSVTYKGIRYCFAEEGFQQKPSATYVYAMADLIAYAETVLPKREHIDDIYLNIRAHGDKIEVGETLSFESLWKALQQVCKVNAGEQYGLFYRYCVKEGIIEDIYEVNTENLKAFFGQEKNLNLLDFCIPMMDERIFSKEEAEVERQAILAFAKWYEENYSEKEYEELCRKLGKNEKADLESKKNQWLQEVGCSRKYQETGKINFQWSKGVIGFAERTGQNISRIGIYEIEENDAIWVWTKETIKSEGYAQMVKGHIKIEPLRKKSFVQARVFLKEYLPQELEKPEIFLCFSDKRTDRSAERVGNRIIIYNHWRDAFYSLLHEYCHVLTIGRDRLISGNKAVWCEGVADWLAMLQLNNEVMYSLVPKKNWHKVRRDYYEIYLKKVQERRADKGVFLAESLYYPERAVIIQYVYENYGMEKLAELTKGDMDFEKVLGITWQEIYFKAVDFVKDRV
jgi:hypothetical protein